MTIRDQALDMLLNLPISMTDRAELAAMILEHYRAGMELEDITDACYPFYRQAVERQVQSNEAASA